MSKRFTDTDKWKDPWFRKLSAGVKMAFGYMCDNCDNAGVWAADFDLADFQIGMKVPWDKVRSELGDRLQVLSDDKWHLTKFVNFQYGELSDQCKPHLSILRLMEKHGIEVNGRVSKGYPKGIDTLQDKDKEKNKEEGVQGKKPKQTIPPDADEALNYATEIGLPESELDAWHDHFAANGWKISGKTPMKDWKASLRTWARNRDAGAFMPMRPIGRTNHDAQNCLNR